jgi:hypothetical protein
MSEFENIFIFVSDALAYSHLPEKIAQESASGSIKTLAPSLHSPQSFTSMLTGLESPNHLVGGFNDIVEEDTLLDFFDSSELYDNENSAIRNVFGLIDDEPQELEEMEEPFVWVERAMETHQPYGGMGHGNNLEIEGGQGKNYYEGKTDEEIRELYDEAVEKMEKHFWRHVEELKERGLYEDTLIIFTSDHGETLGEWIWARKRYGHNSPPTKHVGQVPAVFLNVDPEVDHMRTVDIVPTALSYLGKDWMMETDGVNVREKQEDEGYCLTPMRFFNLKWRWNGENWEPKHKIKALIEDKVYREPFRKAYRKINPYRGN